MAVNNHGVSELLVEEMFAQNSKFFALPTKEKRKILADKNFRGYTPMKVLPKVSRVLSMLFGSDRFEAALQSSFGRIQIAQDPTFFVDDLLTW